MRTPPCIFRLQPVTARRPDFFHYIWRIGELSLFGAKRGGEIKTKSSVYNPTVDHDGAYQLHVVAVDHYCNRIKPKGIDFTATLPKPKSFWEKLIAFWPVIAALVHG